MTIGVNVPVTSSWNDKGFKAAAKDLGVLDGLANKLTKRLAGAFTVGAIGSFAKSSVAAFSQANKQFTVMAQTLNNLGFNVGLTKLEDFFNKLEMQFGKDKSVLIPAFQTLINSTKDYAKSQQLLNLALDVSAGSGKDLGSVAMALGKAYAGQTTALTRLGVGLSTANIKGKTFVDIQKQLTAQFSGSAAMAVDTFQGKMDLLKITYDNMKETIGKGIVDAITNAFSNGNISQFQKAMQNTATYVANIALGLGEVAKEIGRVISAIPKPILDAIASFKNFGVLGLLQSIGKKKASSTADMLASLNDPVATGLANYNNAKKSAQLAKEAAAAAAKELNNSKALTAEKKKQLELQKARAILDQSAKILDVEQASVVAAMMNESLTQNEMLRLQLKKALLDDNAKAAGDFAMKLADSQIAALQLAAANPFGKINLDILSAIASLQAFQQQLLALQVPMKSYLPTISTAAGTYYESSTGLKSTDLNAGTFAQYYNGLSGGLYGSTPVVNVNVQGNVIAQQDLVSAINTGLYNTQANGTPVNWRPGGL